MARKEKKYHFIYKTINLLSGKYYIGMHSTDSLEDGYLGSGRRLRYSINKYGKENHKLEILEFCNSRNELKSREREIVNLDEIAKEECLNLKVGGEGGFTLEQTKNGRKITDSILEKKYGRSWRVLLTKKWWNELNEAEKQIHSKKIIEGQSKINFNHATFKNKKHSEETKKKIGEANSKHQRGKNNSQFGTQWITNGVENKKIKKSDSIPDKWQLGRILYKPG